MNITSGSENDKAMKYVKEYWRLGPEVASIKPKDNKALLGNDGTSMEYNSRRSQTKTMF